MLQAQLASHRRETLMCSCEALPYFLCSVRLSVSQMSLLKTHFLPLPPLPHHLAARTKALWLGGCASSRFLKGFLGPSCPGCGGREGWSPRVCKMESLVAFSSVRLFSPRGWRPWPSALCSPLPRLQHPTPRSPGLVLLCPPLSSALSNRVASCHIWLLKFKLTLT